uniref:Serine aminopeptidase S33 domain-containing protein n=1 Tax=Parascaris univalens TaxID=6257 RepID=A0A914ZPC5_PARUN
MSSFGKWLMIIFAPIVFIYGFIPFLIFCFPAFMHHIFFLNFVKVPFRNYNNLSLHGVKSFGRNFYVESRDGVHLGCWHILPSSLSSMLSNMEVTDESMERSMMTSDFPIIVYLHGNSFDRSTGHRIDLYNVLSDIGFHIIAVDYRGYGDSTGFPTEIGVVQDAKQVFRYVKKFAGDNNIFIWGHSMGTGVASAAVMELCESGMAPDGLILESPFNNLRDVITFHPLAAPFRWLPCFDYILLHPFENSGLNMSSDLRITRVSCPILILHAEDDHIIPAKLGRRLRDAAVAARRDVTYVGFEAERQFRHKYIYMADELPSIITSFVDKCKRKQRSEL